MQRMSDEDRPRERNHDWTNNQIIKSYLRTLLMV